VVLLFFIGDIIDNHYSSYHESDPDGYSAGEELDRAIDMIKIGIELSIATVIIEITIAGYRRSI
jgi:hypothetical protein